MQELVRTIINGLVDDPNLVDIVIDEGLFLTGASRPGSKLWPS